MSIGSRRIVIAHDASGISVVRSDDVLDPQPIPSGNAAFQPGGASPMHRSFSIDDGIVLSGQLEPDGGETVPLAEGDIVVQRGTKHLWLNPSPDQICRTAFVLIEAQSIVIDGKILDEVNP